MQLVEQHIIRAHHPHYRALDTAAFAAKNLYNAALYEIRQSFIHQGKHLYYNQMDKIMQKHEALTVEVHPILHAYLTKGFPSKRMKWSWKYKQKIKVKANSNYHLTEFHFYDKTDEEIKL